MTTRGSPPPNENILRKIEAIEAHERRRWTPREHELHAALEAERAARMAREERERVEKEERVMARWRTPDPAPTD